MKNLSFIRIKLPDSKVSMCNNQGVDPCTLRHSLRHYKTFHSYRES